MVAVVLLGNGRVPPKWRGGACLTAGVCPDPENSGGGLTPEKEVWAPGRREIPESGKLLESGMAGELKRPAGADPMSTSMGVSPCATTDSAD